MNKLLNLSDFQSGFIYRTENGDTVTAIAEKFHTTPAVIIFHNSLTCEVVSGELLYIEKIYGEPYIIEPGDDLERIAEKFCVSPEKIVIKNKTDVFYVGQKIYI